MTKLSPAVIKQVENLNNQMQNGFKVDLEKLLTLSEKTPKKIIKLSDTEELHVSLWFMGQYENCRKVDMVITLNISLYRLKKNDTLFSSQGLGQNIPLKAGFSRKNYKEMAKLTADLTDEYILSVYDESIQRNARIL